MKKKSKNSGIATLPTVIVISLMALAIVVSITSISLNELVISQGSLQSSGALFYAEAGARDALTRIARNKNYTCASTDCYFINFMANGCINGDGCAKVLVSSGDGTSGNPKIIVSKGMKGSSIRRMQVSVTLDAGTSTPSLQNGEISSAVWTELTN